MQNDPGLIERARRHDLEAFSQLYGENFERVFRYIKFKVGSQLEAEDMTQQVFVRAYEALPTFKDVSFSGWLMKIAHNLIVDYLRKKNKRQTVCLDELPLASDENPVLVVEQKSDVAWLKDALGRLTPAQQEVITLRFGSELPIAEVARILGKSEGAVKALQHSALKALRRIRYEEGRGKKS